MTRATYGTARAGGRRVCATSRPPPSVWTAGSCLVGARGGSVPAVLAAAARIVAAGAPHDEAYAAAGALSSDGADVVLRARNAPTDRAAASRRGSSASLLSPALNPALIEKLTAAGVTALAMDAVPHLASPLDVLSSMANIGGYRAVIEAAHEFGSPFRQVTAAGEVPPAKVLVVGAGVARAWPRSGPRRADWGRSCAPSTPAPRWASRSSRWGPSSCGSTSWTRARQRPATPRRWARTSTARPPTTTPRRPRTSTSSSRPPSSPASPRAAARRRDGRLE